MRYTKSTYTLLYYLYFKIGRFDHLARGVAYGWRKDGRADERAAKPQSRGMACISETVQDRDTA